MTDEEKAEKIKRAREYMAMGHFKNKLLHLEKENAELKAQIEKMKCCENCKNWYEDNYWICPNCEHLEKWEMPK